MLEQNYLKQKVAEEALKFIPNNIVLGVGSGSTVNAFIDALGVARIPLKGVVAASIASEERLQALGYEVLDLNSVDELPYYVDGADEVTRYGVMIKGGGAALTREKVIASVAKNFICLVDESKLHQRLGTFPLPVEVVPMARSYVSRKLMALGGQPQFRTGIVTDNNMVIVDVRGLDLTNGIAISEKINNISGVLSHGLFAHRHANKVLVAKSDGSIENIDV